MYCVGLVTYKFNQFPRSTSPSKSESYIVELCMLFTNDIAVLGTLYGAMLHIHVCMMKTTGQAITPITDYIHIVLYPSTYLVMYF